MVAPTPESLSMPRPMSVIYNLCDSARKFLSIPPIRGIRGRNFYSQSLNPDMNMAKTRKQTADALEDLKDNITQNSATNEVKTINVNKKRERLNEGGKESNDSPTSSKKRKTLLESQAIIKEQDPKTRPVVEIMIRDRESPSHKGNVQSTDFIRLESKVEGMKSSKEHITRQTSPDTDIILNKNISETKRQHHKFGSEEPETQILSVSSEISSMNREDEDHDPAEIDDENDAPDAITTQASEQAVKLNMKKTAIAIEAQRLKFRQRRKEQGEKKRQPRNQNLLQQETVIATKRSQDKLEKDKPEKQQTNLPDLKFEPERLPIDYQNALPDLLPLEYLEDDDSDDTPKQLAIFQPPKLTKPKKIKFDDLVEKPPKDYHFGSTTYRVLKPSHQDLAPKATFTARRTKEAWLLGRTGKKQGSSRQPFSRGFINHQKS